ncbi:MAG: cyclophilin-like fold protein [Synergistaceae bacterium]|nr:cyclophilin-like fold protein [Synergistaceae bacterium]
MKKIFLLLLVCLIVNSVVFAESKEQSKNSDEELQIKITAGEVVLDAVLFDNKTAKDFVKMLPLTVETWHPAPNFARAFDLPERIPRYEKPGKSYELGSLAYWYEGPSIAIIYNASRDETVVPVVPIGKITSDVSLFFDYGEVITVELKE